MQKLKGVLDSPILLAAALYPGVCRSILVDALHYHTVYISEDLIKHYLTIINNKEYSSLTSYLQSFIKAYTSCAQIVQTKKTTTRVLPQIYQDIIEDVQPDFLVAGFLSASHVNKVGHTIVLSPHDFSRYLKK